jgi:hypothetical protein
MNELPPTELAWTYGWYQNVLNLRAAELYDTYGLDFLRSLKKQLAWESSGDWSTATLLPNLERIAPGFQSWADDLENGELLQRDRGKKPGRVTRR